VWDQMRKSGVAGSCRVLQCVAVCCSVLQCVSVCCSVLQCEQLHLEVYGWRGIEYVDLARMMLQCVVVCCSVLQCVAMCCGASCGVVTRGRLRLAWYRMRKSGKHDVAVCCSVSCSVSCSGIVAVCCSVAVCHSGACGSLLLAWDGIENLGRTMLQCVAVCCSVLQCVAVCCSVLQCNVAALHVCEEGCFKGVV